MSKPLWFFIFAITILVLVGLSNSCNTKEGLVGNNHNHSKNVSPAISWLLHNGKCKQVNASVDETKNMLKTLSMHGDVFSSADDCKKHHDSKSNHNSNHNSHPNVTFICDNEVDTSLNPHTNPNIHYSNSHHNTGQIPWRSMTQLHG